MTNFAQHIKAEISRIARKEVRAETQALKKASAQHRTEIAALKRRIASLEGSLKKASRGRVEKLAAVQAESDSPSLRFRMGGFAALRKKLGISAAEMGKLLGVSAQSVYHWEAGKTKPRASQLQAISVVRKMGKKEVTSRLTGSGEA